MKSKHGKISQLPIAVRRKSVPTAAFGSLSCAPVLVYSAVIRNGGFVLFTFLLLVLHLSLPPLSGAGGTITAYSAKKKVTEKRIIVEEKERDKCPVSEAEEGEIAEALSFFQNGKKPAKILKELIAARADYNFTGTEISGFKNALPPAYQTRLMTRESEAGKVWYERTEPLAKRIFKLHRVENRVVLLYQSNSPLFALWKGYYVLVSTKAADLLDEEEIAGQIAHETAHLYSMDELKAALEKKDERAARIIELKCDLVGMLTLQKLGRDARKVASGVARMSRYLEENKLIKPQPTHPSLCAREKLARLSVESRGK